MKIKKIILSIVLCTVVATEAFASVLGELKGSNNTDFGAGAVLYNNTFESGSTKQQEFYVDYTPNSESVPVVLNGEQIYGKRTIKEAAKFYDDLNYRPLIGINADYFSFKTGIPMGHTISGGELITKDTTGQNAVGFKADGTAFISWLEIQSKIISEDGREMSLDCINKWCYPGAVTSYFMSDYFGKETKTESKCKFVIFSKSSGNIRIGEDAELIVEDKFDADFSIAIPEGKYVLAVDKSTGNAEQIAFMDSLTVGQKLVMRNESVYDKELWHSAENGLGSVGGRLIENGNIYTNLEKGSAPRTAVGIRQDGKIIFYVVDGRQPGYSSGVTLEALAGRLKELGCVDAINLDGGGSTVIAGVYPGSDTFEVINKPSEGTMRSCANYIFLQDMRKPSGVVKSFTVNNKQNENYLTGAKVTVDVGNVWDTNNYKMNDVNFKFDLLNGDGTLSTIHENNVTLSGNGRTTVKISAGDVTKELFMNVYDFPDEIKTTDNTDTQINLINLKVGENYSQEFISKAYKNNNELISNPESFIYEVEGDIGTISGNMFIADTTKPAEGKIKITAGQAVKTITVRISENNYFADMSSHWAKDAVNSLYEEGLISGEEKDGVWYYNPDNKMTRIEFSSIICKYLKIDVKEYADEVLEYSDKDSLAPWMVNYAKAMSALGVINGIDGAFMPNEPLTRAQAAAIIGRILPEEEDLPNLNFADSNDVPQWAYSHIAKLIKNSVLKGYENNTVRPNANVTRAEAGTVIYNLLTN